MIFEWLGHDCVDFLRFSHYWGFLESFVLKYFRAPSDLCLLYAFCRSLLTFPQRSLPWPTVGFEVDSAFFIFACHYSSSAFCESGGLVCSFIYCDLTWSFIYLICPPSLFSNRLLRHAVGRLCQLSDTDRQQRRRAEHVVFLSSLCRLLYSFPSHASLAAIRHLLVRASSIATNIHNCFSKALRWGALFPPPHCWILLYSIIVGFCCTRSPRE